MKSNTKVDSEEESAQENTETLRFYKERAHKKPKGNPFTTEVLEDFLPSHFRPVSDKCSF